MSRLKTWTERWEHATLFIDPVRKVNKDIPQIGRQIVKKESCGREKGLEIILKKVVVQMVMFGRIIS